jgi:hypothetical protein
LLASGQYSKSATATCRSTLVHSTMSSLSSSPRKSTGSQSGHYTQGFGQSQYLQSARVSSRPSPTQEHISPSLPPLSDHVLKASLDNGHWAHDQYTGTCPHVTSFPLAHSLTPRLIAPDAILLDQKHEQAIRSHRSPTRILWPCRTPISVRLFVNITRNLLLISPRQ